ncbi:MAG: autotransporter outer membrane beta-barrel domain-containing protein [Campylobacteraceae bacterium]|nr:autotransporter outer membrane beta-barrel domain-containing protein [Campylobacteraceae bacterium]
MKKSFAISLFFASFLTSNLSAACTLSGSIIYCDDTVDSSTYGAYPQNSNYDINTTVNGAYGVYNNVTEDWVFNSLNIVTMGGDSSAIYALNSSITTGDNININTVGDRSKGILSGENSYINVGSNINIYTDGQDSIGINAAGTGDDNAHQASRATVNVGDNVLIRTQGSDTYPTQSRSDGIAAKYGDITIGNNVDILTTGIGSWGIRSDYLSTITIGDNLSIVTTGQHGQPSTTYDGWWSYGISSKRGSDITIGDNLYVNIKGNNTYAVQAQTYWATRGFGVSTITIGDNAYIKTEGNDMSRGLYADAGGQINIGDNAYIITIGGTNKGVTSPVAADGRYTSQVNGEWLIPIINMGDNATIISTGGYSHGVYSYYGNITIGDNANIITTGDQSVGVYSWGSGSTNTLESATGGSNVIIGDNLTISTSGGADIVSASYGGPTASHGIIARQNGNVTVGDNADISVSGDKAVAVYVTNYDANANVRNRLPAHVVFNGKSTLNANGNNTKVIELTFANASIHFNGETTFNTLGDGINAFAINNVSNNQFNQNVYFNDTLNINTYGSNSKAVYLDNGYTYDFNALDINVYGPNSYALHVAGGSNLALDNKTSLKAFDDSSYAIYANNGIVSSIGNTLDIFGNLLSDNGGTISLEFDSASSFIGSASLSSGGIMDLSFDNSKWIVSANSTVSDLRLSNGAIVDLSYNNSPLSNPVSLVADNIFGNGIFNVRFDVNNEISDKIFISNSSSGAHTINFYDKTTGGYNPSGNLSLIVVQHLNPAGDYQANFGGHADIGAYTYNLNFDNTTQSYYFGDVTPSGSIVPGGGAVLSNAAVSSIGFLTVNYLSNYINTQNILQRMGELRSSDKDNGDVWARTYFGKLGSFDGNTRIDSVGYYGIQIGADKLSYVKEGKLYTGLTFGYLKSDTDYSIGDSESVMYDFGAYALYKSDNNFYIDTLIKYVQNDNDFNTRTSNNLSVDGSGDSKGFSLSVEVGKRYDRESIYIEPQAELTYAKQGSFSVSSSNNLKTNIDGFDSYLARVGVVLGYKLKDNANLYFKTGYARELGGKTTYSFNDAQNTQKEYKLNQNIFDNALGITISGSNHNLYLEGGLQKGSEFDSLKANVGYRYSF